MFRIESVQFKINWVIKLSFVKMSLSINCTALLILMIFILSKNILFL